MKKFFKDYKNLCKATIDFVCDHPFGMIVANIVAFVGWLSWFFRADIKDFAKEKFGKYFKKTNVPEPTPEERVKY